MQGCLDRLCPSIHPGLKFGSAKRAWSKACCEKIMEGQISSARAERPVLTRVLGVLRGEDALVAWNLDRLGRSVRNLWD